MNTDCIQELLQVSKEVASYLSTQKGMLAQGYAEDLSRAITRAEFTQWDSTNPESEVDFRHEERLQKRVPVAKEEG